MAQCLSSGKLFTRINTRKIPFMTVLILLISQSLLFAEPFDRGPSIRQLGLAVDPVADPVAPGARVFNPAAGAEITDFAISASFARSFNIPEFDRFQIASSIPISSWTTGIWASGFGRELYSERTLGVNASHEIYHRLYAGIGVSGTQIHVKNYGNETGFNLDLGLYWSYQRLSVGLAVQDLWSTEFESFAGNSASTSGKMAARVAISPTLNVLAEIIVEEDYDPGFRTGAELKVLGSIAMRLGYDSLGERIHLGLAISVSGIMAEGAYDHHPWLGWSHAFGLQWYQGAGSW